MQLSLLIGALAAFSSSAHGLVFRDQIVQDVDGTRLTLVHGVQDETEVTLDVNPHSLQNNGWEFNTEGRPDTDATISPIDSPATLVCKEGSPCSLDLDGAEQQAYRIVIVDGGARGPIFTFQDTISSLYVSRAPDLHLELAPEADESAEFRLVKIQSSEES
ncbi:hypothetical protein FE257_012320 [Aspergillus nanangensis]|uniref:Uncharacterized protein n=1 Tax=Aspergillus nanangensis TaxID=2582783 RepID=A0AAD4CGJ5_ASPNN|nr:hypothetical protein FE257_012320 [Aspergillus nanangensis]